MCPSSSSGMVAIPGFFENPRTSARRFEVEDLARITDIIQPFATRERWGMRAYPLGRLPRTACGRLWDGRACRAANPPGCLSTVTAQEWGALAGVPSGSAAGCYDPEPRMPTRMLFFVLLRSERSHINRKAVLHIGLEQSLVGFVDLLDGDDFDIGGDVVCRAKVEHLLGLRDAADVRTGEAAAPHDEAECRDAQGLGGCADKGKVAVEAEKVEIGVDVVPGGDGVEDEVEAAGVLLHLAGVARDDDFVGAEAERVFLLTGRGGEDHDVGSERMSKLHAHVAQAAETDHANFLALCDAPVAHRRVCGDPGAEERRGSGEIKVGGDAQHEAFIDDDAIGVATIGDASEGLVRGVEGEGQVRAELLKAGFAPGTGTVRVDEAADRGEVAGLVLGDC